MKKITLLLCATLAGAVLPGCSDENKGSVEGIIDVPTTADITLSRSEQDINEGINKFAFDFFNAAARAGRHTEDGNLAVSPLSAAINLALLANSGDDALTANIDRALGYGDIATLNSTCNKLMRFLPNGSGDSEMAIANSVWYDDVYSVSADYKNILNDIFYAEVNSADFGDKATAELIDKWCAAKTRGIIPSITDKLPPTELAFLNALYYNGKWQTPFEKEDTKYKDFHGTSHTSIVKMMHTTRDGVYYEMNRCAAISLPFKGDYEMVFILPDEGTTADELSATLSAADFAAKDSYPGKIRLDVPRFTVQSENDLDPVFDAMGISTTFSSMDKMGLGDIQGSFTTRQNTSISVDEDGAVVASVTMSSMPTDANINSRGELILDRPFLYLLRNTVTGSILLAGRINNLPDAE